MAFAATALTSDAGRGISIGPKKVQFMTWTAASADTSGTVTATALSRIDLVIVAGGNLSLTAAATYSGNVATLAFTDPAADAFGTLICLNRIVS